jgi:Protein of unknown function (DUF2924)
MRSANVWQQSGSDPAAIAAAIDEKIHILEKASVHELRQMWHEHHGADAPSGFSKDLLARALSHQIQEDAFGALEKRCLQRLEHRTNPKRPAELNLKSGSVIVREYQGQVHAVTILPDGFSWEGETYPSLSTIAYKITGTKWNGPRFFGLRVKSKRAQKSRDNQQKHGDDVSVASKRRHG